MAVLYINMWDSRCGECGKGCKPEEETHESQIGYWESSEAKRLGVPYPLKGCGARYTELRSDYDDAKLVDSIKTMRPDLPYTGYAPR